MAYSCLRNARIKLINLFYCCSVVSNIFSKVDFILTQKNTSDINQREGTLRCMSTSNWSLAVCRAALRSAGRLSQGRSARLWI